MGRRSPKLHTVRSHNRAGGVSVRSHPRGSGTKTRFSPGSSSGSSSLRILRDAHGRRKRKLGDSISFKNLRGEFVTGTVRAVRKEHFLVERKDQIFKVDRRSIFRQIGGALRTTGRVSKKLVVETPRAVKKVARVAGAIVGAPERAQERLRRFKRSVRAEFEKGKRRGFPKKIRGRKVRTGPRGGKFIIHKGEKIRL